MKPTTRQLRIQASELGAKIRKQDEDWDRALNEEEGLVLLRHLLAQGPLEDIDKTNLLGACAGRGWECAARVMLDHQAPLWVPVSDLAQAEEEDDGRNGFLCSSVLHEAAGCNQVRILDLLFEQGDTFLNEDGSVRWSAGNSPLEWAAYFGAQDSTRWLLDHGHPVDARGANGWTPLLSLMIRMGDTDMQDSLVACGQLLLDAGANILAQTDQDETVLSVIATEQGQNTPIGKFLMAAWQRQALIQQATQRPLGGGRMKI